MSMITEQVKQLREYANNRKGEIRKICLHAADTIDRLAAKVRKENRTEEAKDRQETTIEKILTFIDAEAWEYCDYLIRTDEMYPERNHQEHVSACVSNIRERLTEELPGILSAEYEKAFMDGFESHPTHHVYQKAFEDIRAEIVSQKINKDKRYTEEIWWNSALQKCLEIIDKHDPDKVGKERK